MLSGSKSKTGARAPPSRLRALRPNLRRHSSTTRVASPSSASEKEVSSSTSDQIQAPLDSGSHSHAEHRENLADMSMEELMADPRASLSAAGLEDGPPRFWCPIDTKPPATNDDDDDDDRPLLIYIPGLDGSGFAAMRQWRSISAAFQLECLTIPASDRTSALNLAKIIAGRVATAKREQPNRSVCLLGESMGGLLALLAASEAAGNVDRLYLANPASSFERAPIAAVAPSFPIFPEPLYEALPLVLAPVLIDPVKSTRRVIARTVNDGEAMTSADDVDLNALLTSDPGAVADALLTVLTGFQRTLIECLPKATLAHRLEILRDGCAALDDAALARIQCKTLVLAGDSDLLLPSAEEATRLKQALPNCVTRTYSEVSHAILQDPSVDFSRVVQEYSCYPSLPARRRRRRNKPTHKNSNEPLRRFDNWLPPREEDLAEAKQFLDPQRRLHSPVFLSQHADGRVVRGLGAVPPLNSEKSSGNKPVLFVGNHQLLAGDLGQLIDGLHANTGCWVRGLAHPFVVGGAGAAGGNAGPGGAAGGGSFLRRFGAVPVSGRSLVSLLSNGEPCLLFPGGVREAYKLKNEEYKLLWPEKPEFVRAANRHGALIVPFAAVGAEDCLDLVLDTSEVRNLPDFLGGEARRRADSVRGPRMGGAAEAQLAGESFLSPVAVPNGKLERWYFFFGSPVDMSETGEFAHATEDADTASAAYAEVKRRCQHGLDYLLRERSNDPFQSLLPRVAYEQMYGKSAPTFPLR